ncbi:MAG TPA: ribosome maturation factor RimM [Flavipsychrobacter sp.]|jgi:16S rRNA processing protein RimM|nr:ribosome maturation factor RimM [Flavipsychrobacter sp.]
MIRIGKIVATNGLQGAIVLTHIVGESTWLKKDDVLFLELNKDSFIPFFVIAVKPVNKEEYILNVEDVDTLESAKKLIGKQAYVKEDILSKYTSDSPLLWIGFNIVDKERGSVGAIEDVMQTGHQWLAKVTYEGREVLIPLIDQMILDTNVRNKFIRMELPEGLLDI